MIIDCKHDPNDLIGKIGDRFFSFIEEECDDKKVVLRCCEDSLIIKITTDEFGNLSESADALLILLNQEYKRVRA